MHCSGLPAKETRSLRTQQPSDLGSRSSSPKLIRPPCFQVRSFRGSTSVPVLIALSSAAWRVNVYEVDPQGGGGGAGQLANHGPGQAQHIFVPKRNVSESPGSKCGGFDCLLFCMSRNSEWLHFPPVSPPPCKWNWGSRWPLEFHLWFHFLLCGED